MARLWSSSLLALSSLFACANPDAPKGSSVDDTSKQTPTSVEPKTPQAPQEEEQPAAEGEEPAPAACSGDVVDGAAIRGTEGLVVARDGTIYFSQSEGVGRRNTDGTIDAAFASLPGADTVWGIALAPDQSRLYVGSPSTGTVSVVDTATGAVLFAVEGFAGPNGLTVDADGAVFVSDFSDDAISKLEIGETVDDVVRTPITSALSSPNGLLVDGDDLLALSYSAGTLSQLVDGRKGAPTRVVVVARRLGRPDGIARAADGSFFVTDNAGGRVLHLVEGQEPVEVASGVRAAANLEFGAGALRCDQLLVTSSGQLQTLDVGVAGAPVAWR